MMMRSVRRYLTAAIAAATLVAGAAGADARPDTDHPGGTASRHWAPTQDSSPEAAGPVLERGASGIDVARWQERLDEWLALTSSPRHPIAVDGEFGPETASATAEFQFNEAVADDGDVDDADRQAVRDAIERLVGNPAISLARGDRSPAVAWWQEKVDTWLASTGSALHPIAVDGIFGPETEAATREFESSSSTLTEDGVVGAHDRTTLLEEISASDARPEGFEPIPGLVTISDYESSDRGVQQWLDDVPGARDVRIPSTVDDYQQPAIWVPPTGDGDQPLIVSVHSWSSGYEQELHIPIVQWAQDNGWAVIHPDFRGRNRTPEATGSGLAVQGVVDAIDFAVDQGDVDPDQVYIIGVSGGGMMSILMAGHHPELFAGAVAWVPIHDLNAWYVHNAAQDNRYSREIEASCGGVPTEDPEAHEECAQRSPEAHLDAAREAELPMYIAHGIHDENVPPVHTLWAFNQLADPEDRFSEEALDAVAAGELPAELYGSIEAPTYFGPNDPQVFTARQSGEVTAVLFDGEHTMVYNPGIAWIHDRVTSS